MFFLRGGDLGKWCTTHCHGYMNVAWDLCWGGCWSAKHCLFSCKVAAAGDEGQLVCEAGAATLVSRCDWFRVPATCGYSFVRSFI